MPLPLPHNKEDAMTGNGKKINVAIGIAGAIAAALLAASSSSNQSQAAKHLAEAARLQEKARNSLAGKGEPGDKTVWDMFGDSRGAAPYEEKLLWSPNSSSMGPAGF